MDNPPKKKAPTDAPSKEETKAIYERDLTIEAHIGPLPPPAQIADYERVLPGLATRIVDMAQAEQKFRHQQVQDANNFLRTNSRLGIATAFSLGAIGLIGGIICVLYGHDVAGPAIAGVTLVGLLAAYFKGVNSLLGMRHDEENEDEEPSSDNASVTRREREKLNMDKPK
jgi:uncharacterized membrane protein